MLKINNLKILKIMSKFLGNVDSDNISTLLRTLKKEVQKNSTFVGNEFVSQGAFYERRKN